MAAPVLGFCEVIIWLLAIGQIMKNLSNPARYLAYAAGFASGNYAGMLLEAKEPPRRPPRARVPAASGWPPAGLFLVAVDAAGVVSSWVLS